MGLVLFLKQERKILVTLLHLSFSIFYKIKLRKTSVSPISSHKAKKTT